jgi:hypothetical protein
LFSKCNNSLSFRKYYVHETVTMKLPV